MTINDKELEKITTSLINTMTDSLKTLFIPMFKTIIAALPDNLSAEDAEKEVTKLLTPIADMTVASYRDTANIIAKELNKLKK